MAHTNSLPPSDRPESETAAPVTVTPAPRPRGGKIPVKVITKPGMDGKLRQYNVFKCNEVLREKLLELRDAPGSIWSNSTLGTKLGYTHSVLSNYLSEDGCKYDGDIETLEKRIADFLKAIAERRASGVETSPSQIADEIANAFNYIRKNNQIGVIIAESGAGKSRGTELILADNPLAIFVNVTEWNNSKAGIMAAIWAACPHDGWDRSMPQFQWLVTKYCGSDRPFLFDNAHKLGREALSLVVTFLDEIKCPGALLGLNILVEKLVADLTSQSTSRVGVHWPVKISPKTDKKLLSHIIKSICKDINGELDDLVDLCQQVADHHGHFRAVEQRLKGAAELRRSDVCDGWVEAFRLAHQRSLHPCQLT